MKDAALSLDTPRNQFGNESPVADEEIEKLLGPA
jgi:hypothetical protein